MLDPETHFVISDVHVPSHDKRKVKQMMDRVRHRKPAVIHALGDIMDCYAISKHRRDPDRRVEFHEEVEQAREFFEELREAAGDAKIIYTEGNHEERLRKYIVDGAIELHKLSAVTIPGLLDLKSLDVAWQPASKPYRMVGWWFVHGDVVRKHGGYSARAKAEQIGANTIMGHTHRLAVVGVTNWSHSYLGVENGCLCSLEVEYIQGRPNWQQGFTILEVKDPRKPASPVPVYL